MYRGRLKIVCINDKIKSLTKGKVYETIFTYSEFGEIGGLFFDCINDQGIHQQYRKSNFIPLAIYRKQQISKILNL